MLVAETLAAWATTGSLSGFASAHQRLPLLVAEALKEHVLPIELSASIMAFPAMLRDLDARLVSMSTNVVTFFTSHVHCQNVPKKRAPKIHMVAPITMAATPADSAGVSDGG